MRPTAFRLAIKLRNVATTLAITVGFASWQPALAQDSLSSILNLPQLRGSDELPPPRPATGQSAQSGLSVQVPTPAQAQAQPQQSEPASERIYLGLDAEPPLEGIGVRVATVTKDSPAWKAGFKVDDRILGINGFAIGKLDDMVDQLAKTRPGQSVNFLVRRELRNIELIAVLMNADVADQIQNQAATLTSSPAWLGVTAHDLSGSFRDQFGLGAFRGAAVSQVVNGSPAYKAGIRPGDAIVEIAGRPVETAADLQRWVESGKPGDQAQVIYFRGASRQTAKIVLSIDPQSVATQPATPRVQAFPKTPNIASPGIGPTKPGPAVGPTVAPAQLPPAQLLPAQMPPGQLPPGQLAGQTDPNMPLVLGDQNVPANQPSQREAALEAEVVRLRKELADAQTKLAETKQQLDNILKALKD
ncbi:MAG: PDZ domain-containing protein [Pirellulales bacterium]